MPSTLNKIKNKNEKYSTKLRTYALHHVQVNK